MANSLKALGAVIVMLAMVLSSTAVPLGELSVPAAAAGNGSGGGDAGGGNGRGGGSEGAGPALDRASATNKASIIYAILCPADFKDYLVPLKEWKTKKGMNAEIYTLEEMLAAYGGPAGVPDFAKVHQFLRRLYANNSELKWVLIVGDGDKYSETFPVPYIFTNASKDTEMGDPDTILNYVPSDVMYSGLEHDWYMNYTDPENYGYSRNEDWTPEVYVGRWPSKSIAEVQGNVNKVLNYEKNPPVGDWMRSALLAGSLYDIPNVIAADPNEWKDNQYEWPHDNGRTPILECDKVIPGTMIKKLMLDYNQTYGGGYSPSTDGLDQASFIAEMNAGYSLVTTASHAWVSGNGPTNYIGNGSDPGLKVYEKFHEYYFWDDAQVASNGMRLPLMYSSACDIANFTTISYPYSNIADNRDHTLEQLLKNSNGGAIGFISATNGDWWDPTDGNWWLEINFWKEFFNDSYRPGEALYKDKVDYDGYLKAKKMNNDLPRVRQNKAIYVLLGDPEVPIWTDTPRTLAVEPPARLINARQTVNVTVRDSITSQPVKNAMVAFTAPDCFARGFTDASGKAQIQIEPFSTGLINLTVTAHNYLPAEPPAVEVVLAPPDLTVGPGDIQMSGSGPVIRAGECVTVSAVVSNIGGLAADNVPVNFYDGNPAQAGKVIGTFTMPSLPAHKNATAQISWSATDGTKALYVWADPANAVTELDEGNNIASVGLTVSAIDLAISPADISIDPSVLIDGAPAAASGAVLAINVTVHNLGSGAAGAFYVRFYDGDPRGNSTVIEGDKRIDVINASTTGRASVTWNLTSRAGPHSIFVIVNPKGLMNRILEYDDTNNEANLTVLLDAPPSFTMPVGPVSTEEDRSLNNFLDLTAFVADLDDDVSDLRFRLVSSTAAGANASVTPEGLLSLRPLPDWNGMGVATVGVSDRVSEAYTTFNVTVRSVNDPPVIDPIPEVTLQVGQLFVYNVTSRDPDLDYGDSLTFTAETDLFTLNRTSGKITYIPAAAHVGKHTVKITVTDIGQLTASTFWTFTVTKPNSPPVLQIGNDLTLLAMETKPLYYKFNATHADADAPVFSVDTGMFTINPATGEISFTPPKGTAGIYKFNVTVKDAGGLGDTRTVILKIEKLPTTNGGNGGTSGLLYIALIFIAAICVGIAFVIGQRIRGHGKRTGPAGPEKERYEAMYGAGTYEYAKKSGSSSLREFREAEKPKQAAVPPKCPKCGSTKIQTFPDGGHICNKCGATFK